MALNLLRCGRRLIERIRNGEIPLITDDRWLPNPTDALRAGLLPQADAVAATAKDA